MINEIRIFLSNILWTFRNVFSRNRKIFSSISRYLANGVFCNSLYCDYIYEESHKCHFDNVTFASSSYQNPLAKIIIAFVTKIVKYKNKKNNGEGFGGTEIIISSSLNEYKIFNIEKKAVLTLYSDRDKMNRILANKKKFELFFNVVKTLEIDKTNSYCIEEYICHNFFDKEKAFFYIAAQYAEYVKVVSCYKNEKIEAYILFFAQRFGESDLLFQIKDFPMIFSHGDLWKSNVIYDGSRFFITDFEVAEPRFILYDLFCFIFTEYVSYDDSTMIRNYFKGKYDGCFSELLLSANIVFDKEKRGLYLLAYLVSVLYERWKTYFAFDKKIFNIIKTYIPNYR